MLLLRHCFELGSLFNRFLIINDGSSIDFYISHGKGIGAGVTINDVSSWAAIDFTVSVHIFLTLQKQYNNNSVTGSKWNTMWFYGVPASKSLQ